MDTPSEDRADPEYDPKWNYIPVVSLVAAIIGAVPVWGVVMLGQFEFVACPMSLTGTCAEETVYWSAAALSGIAALVCAVLTWPWPRRRRMRPVRLAFLIGELAGACAAVLLIFTMP
ncbi:hypothetical protein [Nocardiopsis suaedae]|uniref:Transmembrane protein n=1 Tax=Nocardiopsis suaedae TaxID=3018444 RepID=A0ABT4TSD5_9ACTN|nr:hypothetical protein [Nocardiopsis suaedae]MDA2807057.1 hypothetical protein [Nocardiopsis suaedae]